MILDLQNFRVWVFQGIGVADILGQNSYVVPLNPRDERALCCDGPSFDMTFQKITVLLALLQRPHPLAHAQTMPPQSEQQCWKRASKESSHSLLPSVPAQ